MHKNIQVFPNKSIELQAEIWDFGRRFALLEVEMNCKYRDDHAGWHIGITIMNLYVGMTFYDHRHWDWEKNKREEINEQKKS